MEKHIKRSKHLENAKKNNIGLSFEECIERVCIGANDKKKSPVFLEVEGPKAMLVCNHRSIPNVNRVC